jgi:tight adherence protein D
MLFKKNVIFLLITTLFGCVSQQELDVDSTKEEILIATNNEKGLIQFYKDKLRLDDKQSDRDKLALAYFNLGDYESADFIFSTMDLPLRDTSSLILEAKNLIELGDITESLEILLKVYESDKSNAEVENLLGVAYSLKGDLKTARHYFILSRKHFYDDVKVQNNLAVIDILEEKYQQANDRLVKLYYEYSDDKRIKSNLILSAAKSGDRMFINRLLSNELSEEQINKRYKSIRQVITPTAKLASTGSGDDGN